MLKIFFVIIFFFLFISVFACCTLEIILIISSFPIQYYDYCNVICSWRSSHIWRRCRKDGRLRLFSHHRAVCIGICFDRGREREENARSFNQESDCIQRHFPIDGRTNGLNRKSKKTSNNEETEEGEGGKAEEEEEEEEKNIVNPLVESQLFLSEASPFQSDCHLLLPFYPHRHVLMTKKQQHSKAFNARYF